MFNCTSPTITHTDDVSLPKVDEQRHYTKEQLDKMLKQISNRQRWWTDMTDDHGRWTMETKENNKTRDKILSLKECKG